MKDPGDRNVSDTAIERPLPMQPLQLPSVSRRRILGGLDAAPLLMIGTGRQACLTNLPTLLGIADVRVVAVGGTYREPWKLLP